MAAELSRYGISAVITPGRLSLSTGGKYKFIGEGVSPEEAKAMAEQQLDTFVGIVRPDSPPILTGGPIVYEDPQAEL